MEGDVLDFSINIHYLNFIIDHPSSRNKSNINNELLKEWENKMKSKSDSPSKSTTYAKQNNDEEDSKSKDNDEIEQELVKQRRHRLFIEKQVQKLAQEHPDKLAEKSNYILKRINTK
jgi:hypothetical protein